MGEDDQERGGRERELENLGFRASWAMETERQSAVSVSSRA
eukprot:CAMPEP_0119540612 /NCGR_PEP_ID=MMETSP1344-20130328/52447_1 /TAXON_ID=236787 /ORGANISM="Florenciella parvula, Strain CCMP2471" /LENGTH=40 /DNA_ID= /DNA_START= /DNA_END= /DNA_ORIENTATION=